MSEAIDQATALLAKILDPVAQCFTPEVAKRVAELYQFPLIIVHILPGISMREASQMWVMHHAQREMVLRADPDVQARLQELAEKCNEGTMTPEETAEYDTYIQAMDVVAGLQKKARTLIVQPRAS